MRLNVQDIRKLLYISYYEKCLKTLFYKFTIYAECHKTVSQTFCLMGIHLERLLYWPSFIISSRSFAVITGFPFFYPDFVSVQKVNV